MMQYLSPGNFQDLSLVWRLGFVALVIWSLAWKGWALWLSARKGDKVWFLVLLVLNMVGIPEILYIYFFSKMDKKSSLQNSAENKQM
ncbi:MAG: DUF5652 family protein [Patescibacteria group bacterium]